MSNEDLHPYEGENEPLDVFETFPAFHGKTSELTSGVYGRLTRIETGDLDGGSVNPNIHEKKLNTPIKELWNGVDPLDHKRQALEEIDAYMIEEAGADVATLAKSFAERVDLTTRLGTVRRLMDETSKRVLLENAPDFFNTSERLINHWGTLLLTRKDAIGTYDQFVSWWDRVENEDVLKVIQKQEPMLLPYMWSLLSGDTTKQNEAFFSEMLFNKSENIDVDFDQDGVCILSLSVEDVIGKESVIADLMNSRIGVRSTRANMYVPFNNDEKRLLRHWYENNVDGTDELIEIVKKDSPIVIDSGKKAFFAAVGVAMKKCDGYVGFGHGFGAYKGIWDNVVGNYLWNASPVDTRRIGGFEKRKIGFSLSTKGSEDTAIKGKSGWMDRSAVHISEAIQTMGLGNAANRLLVWIGHSMGGQEALWLPLYAHDAWNLRVISVTPKVSSLQESLLLFYGDLGGTLMRMNFSLPNWAASIVAKIGVWDFWKGSSIVKHYARKMIIPKGMSEKDAAKLEHCVQGHVEQYGDVQFMKGVYRGLMGDKRFTRQRLAMIRRLYKNVVAAILVGGQDRMLQSSEMYKDLEETGWVHAKKVYYMSKLPHYMTHTEEGIHLLSALLGALFYPNTYDMPPARPC